MNPGGGDSESSVVGWRSTRRRLGAARARLLRIIPGRAVRRVPVGMLSIAALIVAVLAFIRAALLVRGPVASTADPALVGSLRFMVGLFALAVVCLAVALYRWTKTVRLERFDTVQMRRIFNAMNHIEDGLMVIDPQGQIIGCNLAARRLAQGAIEPGTRVQDAFVFLEEEDLGRLLDAAHSEERISFIKEGPEETIFRIRAYPSDTIMVLVIVDITEEQKASAVEEQHAHMQLIGRIAQGVAHDFNNILCAISAHADLLLTRSEDAGGFERDAVATIADEANRGAMVARQLVDLSRAPETVPDPVDLGDTVIRAATLLRKLIPEPWEVVADEARAEIFPNMPANQLEQLLIRFGLQLADEYDEPGSVHIHIRRPAAEPAHRKGDEFAGYIVMGVASPGASFEPESYTPDTAPALSRDGGGVVQSVALSFLERQGGQLTVLVREGGFHAFRIGLTALDERAAPLGEGEETLRLEGANALLVQPAIWSDGVTSALLEEIGASVTVVNNIVGGDGPPGTSRHLRVGRDRRVAAGYGSRRHD